MAKYTSKFTGKEIDKKLQDVEDKAARIGFKNMTMYVFASAEDKQEWESEGVENWLEAVPLVIVGTERKIQITNKSGNNNPYFTTTQEKAEIIVTFKSLEKDVIATEYQEVMEDVLYTVSIDKGSSGNWTVVSSDVLVKYGNEYKIDIKNYLAIGANRVIIKAVGSSTGATGQLNITANLTSMYLQPANFQWYNPFIEGETYSLGGVNVGGEIYKVLHIKVSNELGYVKKYTEEKDMGYSQYINTAYFFNKLEFPTSGTGIYNVELWLDANGVESTHLVYNIMCISAEEKTTAQLVAVSNAPSVLINYADNKLFDYAVYDKGLAKTSPHLVVKSIINQNPTILISEDLVNVDTAKANSYEMGVEIESQEYNIQVTADISLGKTVQNIVYDVDNSLSYPPTAGFTFYLNPTLRNNSQDNKEEIINIATNSPISAEWTKMAWTDGVDGWTVDEAGRKCLAIPARSKCIIDLSPLSSVGDGKTIEFTYKVRNVSDYSEPIISICDVPQNKKFKGIKITPMSVIAHSNDLDASDLTQGLNVQDEVELNIIITIIRNYKTTYGNLCQIYVNGKKSRSFEFSIKDSWNTDAKIILGSNTADLYLYKMFVYEKGFDKQDAERNRVASLNLPEEKKHLYELIKSVRDDKGYIDYDAVYNKYNTMEVEMLNGAALPHKGLLKEYSAWCNVEFNFVDLPDYYKNKVWKFLLEKCKIEGQGTTSMNYWLWNLRFRIDKSDNIVIIYPDGQEVTI